MNAHTRAEENARRENSLVEGRRRRDDDVNGATSMSAELEFAEKRRDPRRRSHTDVDRSLYLHFEDISYSVRRGIFDQGYICAYNIHRYNDLKHILQGVSNVKCLEDIFAKLVVVREMSQIKFTRSKSLLPRENKVSKVIFQVHEDESRFCKMEPFKFFTNRFLSIFDVENYKDDEKFNNII